jgi:hypothetical protein
MRRFCQIFGFYPDFKFLLFFLTLFLLGVYDILRFHIRPYVDEWTMGILDRTMRHKKRR